jgi:hypothetical protein
MARKTPVPKKSVWKKLAGPTSNLMDIVTRSRMSQKPVKGGHPKTKEEDFRARRRKLYRLATEEKPMFPFQQKNFHSFVMENKEVVKTLSLLSACTQDMKQVTAKTLSKILAQPCPTGNDTIHLSMEAVQYTVEEREDATGTPHCLSERV